MKKKKMKKKMKLILCLLLFVLFVFLLWNSSKIKFKKELELSLNRESYQKDIVSKVLNGKHLTENERIDTSSLGEKEVIVSFKTFYGLTKKYKVKVKVVDKESPTITYQNTITTTKGKEIDLTKGVEVYDNSNEEIAVSVEGDYDINKVGEYTLYYIAKDSSGNRTTEEFTLKVLEKGATGSETYFTTSKGFQGVVRDGATYIDGTLIVNKSYGLPSTFGSGLTNETMTAFKKLQSAALLDGLNIYIASGWRSYQKQVTLYNNYVARDGKEAADTYSARPGYSEHQSGFTFDVNEVSDKFIGTPEANWLSDNCYKYGFILRYPKGKQDITGFKYESWHFRYVGEELATKLYNNGDWLTLEEYFGIDSVYKD